MKRGGGGGSPSAAGAAGMPGGIDPNELFAQMFGQAMGAGGRGFRGGGFGPGMQFGFGPGMRGMGGGVQAADLNELLSGLFGGGAASSAPAGAQPGGSGSASSRVVVQPMELSLEELYTGGSKTARHGGKNFNIDVRKGWKVRTTAPAITMRPGLRMLLATFHMRTRTDALFRSPALCARRLRL